VDNASGSVIGDVTSTAGEHGMVILFLTILMLRLMTILLDAGQGFSRSGVGLALAFESRNGLV